MVNAPALVTLINNPGEGMQPGELFPVTVPVTWRVATRPLSDPASLPLFKGANVIVTTLFTETMSRECDALRAILVPAAGYENIAGTAVPQGCSVANAYEHEWPIAEWVIMAMVALDHELMKSDRTFRAGSWEMWPQRHGSYRELRGRTLGVIGLGRIGLQTAGVAKALGMRCIAATRTPTGKSHLRKAMDKIVGMDRLGDVLAESDFVLVATPLRPDTTGLVGSAELLRMKPGAYIINPARGPIIDEAALYEALKEKRIAGAALDTWWRYPQGRDDTPRPSRLPFWELDNVIMTPHHSGATIGTRERRGRIVAENIDRLYRGEALINVVAELSKA